MALVIAPHPIDRATPKYAEVLAHAEAAPACPEIRAYWSEAHGAWLAIEGSHRLAVCDALGYVPTIVPITWEQEIEHDLQDYPSPCTVSDLEPWLMGSRRVTRANTYRWEDCDVAGGQS